MSALGFSADAEGRDNWFDDGIRNAGQEPRPDRIRADIVEAKGFGPGSYGTGVFLPLFDALQKVELENSRNGALDHVKAELPEVREFLKHSAEIRARIDPRASFVLALHKDRDSALRVLLARAEATVAEIEEPFSLADWLDAELEAPLTMIAGKGLGGAVLTQGEVALLSGAGGLGKTLAALQVAMAAAAGDPWGTAVGLDIGRAPVVFASSEDRGFRMRQRVLAILRELAGGAQFVIGTGDRSTYAGATREDVRSAMRRIAFLDIGDQPLYETKQRFDPPVPGAGWDRLWRAVDRIAPDGGALVIVDPVTAAFDINHNDAGSVRRVIQALRREATPRNVGALLVAHSNKRGRLEGAEDADLVSGSVAWVDACRGVLTLTRYPEGGKRDYTLRCTKANYGPSGWRQPLVTHQDSYVWHTMGKIQS